MSEGPEFSCQVIDVDGDPVAVYGSAPMSAEAKEAFAEVVRAAKRKHAVVEGTA